MPRLNAQHDPCRSAVDRSHASVINVATGDVIMTSAGGWIEAKWRPDGGAIAFQSATRNGAQQPAVVVVAVPEGCIIAQVFSSVAQYPIAFSADGSLLALRDAGSGHIDIIQASTGSLVSTFNGLAAAEFSPSGQQIMGPSASLDGCLCIVDVASGQQVGSISLACPVPGHVHQLDMFQASRLWSPDSKLISVGAACDAFMLAIFQVSSCEELCRVSLPCSGESLMSVPGTLQWHNDCTRILAHVPSGQSRVSVISFEPGI